jgi:hypothetical protein
VSPHSDPTTNPTTSVLDGDTRVLIPIGEAADRMSVSVWMAYKLARSGELPTVRLGHCLYVPAAVLRRIEQGLPPKGGEVA